MNVRANIPLFHDSGPIKLVRDLAGRPANGRSKRGKFEGVGWVAAVECFYLCIELSNFLLVLPCSFIKGTYTKREFSNEERRGEAGGGGRG